MSLHFGRRLVCGGNRRFGFLSWGFLEWWNGRSAGWEEFGVEFALDLVGLGFNFFIKKNYRFLENLDKEDCYDKGRVKEDLET